MIVFPVQIAVMHVYHSGLKHSFPIFGTTSPLFCFHIQTTFELQKPYSLNPSTHILGVKLIYLDLDNRLIEKVCDSALH